MEGPGLPTRGSSARVGPLIGLTIFACCLIWLSASVSATPQAHGDRAPGTVVPNHYIVVLKDSVDHPGVVAHAQVASHGGHVGFIYRHALKGYSAVLSKHATESLRRDPSVRFVTPDRIGRLFAQFPSTGVQRVFALTNPYLAINEENDAYVNADVAVLDTGVDFSHPDLNPTISVYCVGPEEDPEEAECVKGEGTDSIGHGTRVAGVAGAVDNTFGTVGVAPGVRITSVQVSTAAPQEAWVVAGIDWVVGEAKNIEVANASWGCECEWPTVEMAVEALVEAGVVFVAAAGNEGEVNAKEISPARNPDAITVGAIADYDGEPGGLSEAPPCAVDAGEEDDTWANFSSWGSVVDVVAPGVCIYTTGRFGGVYEYATGTSFAAPAVAGAAAILASKENPANKADVEAIRETIEREGNFNWSAEHLGAQQPLLDVGTTATEGLCDQDPGKGEAEVCPEGHSVSHVHEVSVANALLLNSLGNVKCEVLFLSTAVSGAGSPQVIKGKFTYSGCFRKKVFGGEESCTVTELNGPAELKVLRESHETASVVGEGEVEVKCGSVIQCVFNGENLKATAKGPLLSNEARPNGEVTLSEQTTHAVKGSFCPSTAKLDITTTPLSATYIP